MTVYLWRWQPSAITKQYSNIIIPDTKNVRQKLSSRPVIILNTAIDIMQKLVTVKTNIATNEIIELPVEMWT